MVIHASIRESQSEWAVDRAAISKGSVPGQPYVRVGCVDDTVKRQGHSPAGMMVMHVLVEASVDVMLLLLRWWRWKVADWWILEGAVLVLSLVVGGQHGAQGLDGSGLLAERSIKAGGIGVADACRAHGLHRAIIVRGPHAVIKWAHR